MIKEPIQTFKLLLEKHGDSIIYETKTLVKGTYVIVDIEKDSYEIFNIEGKDDVINPFIYKELCKMDYLSSLVSMDKPVDSKKTIHSNNYMSFFIKKENLNEEIVNNIENTKSIFNAIPRYFDAIQNIIPEKTSNKKDDILKLKMYDLLENKILDIDMEKLEKNKSWLENNILKLKKDSEYKDDKNYLKIFFKDTEERFLNEYNRYLVPKIYNSNDYNVYVNDILYGLPGDNMQLNSNKPSLKLMTRKNYCPTLLTLEEALLQYKFFNYLMNFALNGERVLYVNDEGFYTYDQIKERRNSFNGYLLKLKRGTTLNIVDFNVIMGYKSNQLNKEFNFINILETKEDEDYSIKYGKKQTLIELHNLVNDIIFYKMLESNYFNDDIKIKNQNLKKMIELTKDNMFNWFYLGKEKEGYLALKRIFVDIIKNTLYQGYFNKAKIQFNLLYSLMLHFENGGENMSNLIDDVRKQLISKIEIASTKNEVQYIDNDEQYYYSVGQLAKYLLSLKNTSKLSQSEINSILNSRNDKKLKNEIEKLYKKNNHSKYINSKKFTTLYSMVLSYSPTSLKIDSTSLLAGFLGISILKNNNNEEN